MQEVAQLRSEKADLAAQLGIALAAVADMPAQVRQSTKLIVWRAQDASCAQDLSWWIIASEGL